jgi:hypothetical protein
MSIFNFQKKNKVEDKSNRENSLLGDQPVHFTIGDENEKVKTMGRVGQPLSDVAAAADVFIKFKCKKGECGTCAVLHDGQWIKTCQTTIPQLGPGESFNIKVREVASAKNGKAPSTFFSPASFVEGVVNNGLGVVGFVAEGVKAKEEFGVRMDREAEIAAKVEEIKRRKKAQNT